MNNGENRHYNRKTGGSLGKQKTSRAERDAARAMRDSDIPRTPAVVPLSTTDRTRLPGAGLGQGPEGQRLPRHMVRAEDDRRARL